MVTVPNQLVIIFYLPLNDRIACSGNKTPTVPDPHWTYSNTEVIIIYNAFGNNLKQNKTYEEPNVIRL